MKGKKPQYFPQKNLSEFHPTLIHNFNLQQKQSLRFKLIFFNHGTKIFQEENHGRHDNHISYRRNEEPMATEPIYLSSDESEYSTPNKTPDHQPECIYPDSINQLIVSQLEQRSNMGTETIFYPPTPNTSMISDDEDPMNLTPIIGNPEQYTPQTPPRRNHPIQLCQHVQPIPDTPESPTPENRGRSDDFYPDNIPLNNPPPPISSQ